MGRWEPNAEQRLREAALELFVERGYEQTTVADIAQRAGLTARTFFRYFTDKREVLFAGSLGLEERMAAALEAAPASAGPLAAVAAALDATAEVLTDRQLSRRRNAVISANAELRERELIKMSKLGEALAHGLRRRGVDEPAARLAAEAGMAVFRIGFGRWLEEGGELARLFRDSLDELASLTRTRPPRRAAAEK